MVRRKDCGRSTVFLIRFSVMKLFFKATMMLTITCITKSENNPHWTRQVDQQKIWSFNV